MPPKKKKSHRQETAAGALAVSASMPRLAASDAGTVQPAADAGASEVPVMAAAQPAASASAGEVPGVAAAQLAADASAGEVPEMAAARLAAVAAEDSEEPDLVMCATDVVFCFSDFSETRKTRKNREAENRHPDQINQKTESQKSQKSQKVRRVRRVRRTRRVREAEQEGTALGDLGLELDFDDGDAESMVLAGM